MTTTVDTVAFAPEGAPPAPAEAAPDAAKGAMLEGGSYDVIRRRLLEQAAELAAKADALNAKRKEVFGGSELELVANERVRTENNCVPRDIVSVGGRLLFGYNVFIGLKAETVVSDVFSLHQFATHSGGFDLSPLGPEELGGFLSDPTFVKEFKDLYRYNKGTRLLQLRRTDTRLLAIFQIGAALTDVKVFRWGIAKGGRIGYVDARGEEDNVRPRAHEFEWTPTSRDDHVAGVHPHVSILDEVFVETVEGDLTVKIENNTESGLGVFSEPVDDPNQALDDAEIHYAALGALILIRVLPFREKDPRYLVFNRRTKKVVRIDAIGVACLELPEDQGIVFPGGYYLRTGDHKVFDGDPSELVFERVIRSPNGEDVLYVFHRIDDGFYVLFPYNLIRKEVANPIQCHGYSLFDDGKMVVFRALTAEPTRVHPMQIWQTPFTTSEFAAAAPTDGSYLAKVGNADLVRGISDAYTLRRLAETELPIRQTYEDVIAAAGKMIDAYYWLGHAEAGTLAPSVAAIRKTAELVIDEFEKVQAIKKRAADAVAEAARAQADLRTRLLPDDMTTVDAFMGALTDLRRQRGRLITLRDMRFVDLGRIDELEKDVVEHFDGISRACVGFLLKDDALRPLTGSLAELLSKIEAVKKAAELGPLAADLDRVNEGIGLLAEIVGGLAIEDSTARTKILEGISEVYAQLNRSRATLASRKKDLSSVEGRAEFGVQIKLFGQSVTSALSLCDTPERCDENLSKLLVQLEELEGRFSEFDEFLTELAEKREEVTEAVGARRQTLLDERQRRVQNLMSAAERIVTGVGRRARGLKGVDELNGYFASDPMVLKLREIAEQLLGLGDTVKADEIQSRLKSAKQDALRALRDKQDLFEDGENVIKLGRHRFHVQTQPLELTIVPRKAGDQGETQLFLHLTGTDYYEAIDEPAFREAKDLWDQTLVSETPDVYRSEYLAASMLAAAEARQADLSLETLQFAGLQSGGRGLLEAARAFSAERHDEGYERGVHDADAALLLEKLLSLRATAGLLRYGTVPRALACLAWASCDEPTRALVHRRARSLGRLREKLTHADAQAALARELTETIARIAKEHGLVEEAALSSAAAGYLVLELAAERPRFVTSGDAAALCDALRAHLDREGGRLAFEEDVRSLEAHPSALLQLVRAWLEGFAGSGDPRLRRFVLEAAVMMVTERRIDREASAAVVEANVQGLLGQHPRITDRAMTLRLDEFLARTEAFRLERAPRFRAFRKLRYEVLERERKRLRLDEFAPRVLSSFVRNRLIDEVYLPLVGANLAKQLGAAGEGKRTDLMGMLLLVSPPGYGKTTLMEYVASRLGLVFMKVNGPALGHEVTSLDPADAPNATARQEVDKVNLALEMGNNVMLYLDDIQHTSPELLQKFISLCDAQRRIEGVWRGRTRTYDLRGKKFCVVMAGNPYTESGAKFQIPDMLANRADTYNLGDILEGKGDLFALSYLENALTSNTVLAPLAGRDATDVHKLIEMAKGRDVPQTDLAHGYSAAEVGEIVAVLQRLFKIQTTLLAVNGQYIASASQDDAFRTEPSFKLQGSYRNMNKLAEKVVPAHTDEELERLLDDHYTGEAQTLTTGAEHNLLKLAELRGRQASEQKARWADIKKNYVRGKVMGGKDADPVARVTGTLSELGDHLEAIRGAVAEAVVAAKTRPPEPKTNGPSAELPKLLEKIEGLVRTMARPKLEVKVEHDGAVAELLAQQLSVVERAMTPFARAATQGAASAQSLDLRLSELAGVIRSLEERILHGGTGGAPPPRYEAPLGTNSATNFYRGLASGDVIQSGGLFVATFRKLPARGSPVSLRVSLPSGAEFDALGVVEWTRESNDLDAPEEPPGFGARLTQVPPEVRQLVDQYVRARQPILYEEA